MTPLAYFDSRTARTLALASALAAAAAGCIAHAPAPASGGGTAAAAGDAGGAPAPTPLRGAAAAAGRHVGVAIDVGQLRSPIYRRTAAQQFDSVTPENVMKWETVEPAPGRFGFAPGDQLVAFAAENNMRVRGHTLVWHSQLASWVRGLSGDALHAAMIAHVRGVVGHWKGQIKQWDVVNEALADGSGGGLRADSPFTKLGPTFIDDAFRAAHEADPDAQLFYNDYEIEGIGVPKSEAAYELARRLKEAGVPISGVGFQMHVDPRHWPSADDIRRNIERYAALGLKVEITEMDVPIGEMEGNRQAKLQEQKTLTHDIVAACQAVPACTGITFWGLTDEQSWLNSPQWAVLRGKGPHLPLPFDAAYHPKPMVAGIVDALAGH
jgi:endo-1,4-beta-xylanase